MIDKSKSIPAYYDRSSHHLMGLDRNAQRTGALRPTFRRFTLFSIPNKVAQLRHTRAKQIRVGCERKTIDWNRKKKPRNRNRVYTWPNRAKHQDKTS